MHDYPTITVFQGEFDVSEDISNNILWWKWFLVSLKLKKSKLFDKTTQKYAGTYAICKRIFVEHIWFIDTERQQTLVL